MKNKTILALAILIVTLFAITAVSANENITNEIVSVDEAKVNLTTDNVNPGSFKELSEEIDSKNPGDTVDLYRNFEGSNEIIINKDITINGHGYSLNSNSKTRIFNITTCSVTLKNINFINGKSSEFGGAIYLSLGSNLTIINSTFTNCFAECGGAIYLEGNSNLEITDCNFTYNTANILGGAIAVWNECDVSLTRTNFTTNTAKHESGGAVMCIFSNLNADTINVNDCISEFGGAITLLSSNATITHSLFRKNRATYDGGAIFSMNEKLNLNNNIFQDNTAKRAGAVYSSLNNLTITKNQFTDNTDSGIGVIYVMKATDKYISTDNTFTGNTGDNVFETEKNNLTIIAGDYGQFQYQNEEYTSIPDYYSLTDYNYVTPVKNQGVDGNCWAFTAMGVLESCILKASNLTLDLSEANLKNLMAMFSDYGRKILTNDGGNYKMVSGYFASWLGPILDKDDVYYENDFLSPLLNSILHVQNIIYFNRTSYDDNNAIKEAILKYGAVGTGIYYNDNYFNKDTNAYYYNGEHEGNHAVCIVGWNDTYSADNFKNKPERDGAWIVRNSWGSNWGNNGYFYVSYYDTKCAEINQLESYTFILNYTISFNRIYQYEIQSTSFNTINNNNVYYKNIFTVEGDEYLAAVSTYFADVCEYELNIQINDNQDITKTGKTSMGYYTINLDNPIKLNKNDKVTVQFKCYKFKNGNATMPLSYQSDTVNLHLQQGVSYYGYDNNQGIDLYDIGAVACIKIFTTFSKETKINPYLIPEETYRDNAFIINFALPNDATGFINITVGNNHYPIDVSKTRSIKLYDLTEENNTLIIKYSGDMKYADKIIHYTVNTNISGIGTGEELQKLIKNNRILDLYKDYIFDSTMSDGIVISDYITINGHGHTISGANLARIFNIQVDNVVLENIIFTDCIGENGGVIQVYGEYCQIINCSFINNTANKWGGAIYWIADNGIIRDSYFENNSAITPDYGAGAVFLYNKNGLILNSTFINNYGSGAAVYLYNNNNEIRDSTFKNHFISQSSIICIFGDDNHIINSNFENNSASITTVYIKANNTIIDNCNFTKCIGDDSSAILLRGDNSIINHCLFSDNNGNNSGGAVSLRGNYCNLTNSKFINNTANTHFGGAVYLNGNQLLLLNNTFANNNANYGGAICISSSETQLLNSVFENNTVSWYGGAVYWNQEDGLLYNSTFTDNSASYGGDVFWVGGNGKLINSTFTNTLSNTPIYWHNENSGTIQGCRFPNKASGNVRKGGAEFIKNTIELTSNEYQVDYNSPDGALIKFRVVEGVPLTLTFTISGKPSKITLENDTAVLLNEITGLNQGRVTVGVKFDGDDNYNSFNNDFTLTINKAKTILTLECLNTTVNHPTILTVNVVDSFNQPVNEGTVTFKNGQTTIGTANIKNGIATFTYSPTNYGEFTIKAEYNHDNYLSSNDNCKLLVDTAIIKAYNAQSTLGVSTTLTANVSAVYGVISDGSVSFYVNDAFVGQVNVENAMASISYTPLTAGDLTVKAVYQSSKYANVEDTAILTVEKAGSSITIDSLTSTVGYASTVRAHITSNNVIVNDGSVSFYEDNIFIGTGDVSNGVATIQYIAKSAGKHNISAKFNSGNFNSSAYSVITDAGKGATSLSTDSIFNVNYLDNVRLTFKVTSNNLKVNEGSVKLYLDGSLISTVNVNDGVAEFSLLADNIGVFGLSIVYDGTVNYLSSDIVKTLTVNSLSTKITMDSNAVVYNNVGVLTVSLRDANGNTLSGESLTVDFNGVRSVTTDSNGQFVLTYVGLAPNTYSVSVTFEGNDKYSKSTATGSVVVLKATPKLTAGKKTFNRKVKTKKYTVTLRTHQNKVLAKVKLTLKVNGKTYSANTNAKGKATFKIKKLTKKGTYKSVVSFNGNAFYNKVTKTVKITVK